MSNGIICEYAAQNKKRKEKKYPIESTTPGFPELEKALFIAKDKLAWKDMVPFIIAWLKKHNPKDTVYTVEFFTKHLHH